MDITQTVQTGCAQVPQFPDHLWGHGLLAPCDASQLRTMGPHLLRL